MDISGSSKSAEYPAQAERLLEFMKMLNGVFNTNAGWFKKRQCRRRFGTLGAALSIPERRRGND